MNMKSMVMKRMERITNPSMSEKGKAEYAGWEMKAMILVAHKWNAPLDEVFRIIAESEDAEVPMWEPDEHTSEESRIFWDFIAEMEPFDFAP